MAGGDGAERWGRWRRGCHPPLHTLPSQVALPALAVAPGHSCAGVFPVPWALSNCQHLSRQSRTRPHLPSYNVFFKKENKKK